MNLLTTETDEELATARGQIGVLRDLLMEALSVLDDIGVNTFAEAASIDKLMKQMRAAIEGTKP